METWSVLAKPNLTERAKAKAWQTYFSVSPCCKKGEAVVNLSFSTTLVWHCAFQALRQQCQEWIMTMFLLWDRDSECQASLSALQRVLGISNSSTLPIQVQQINSEVWFLGQIGQTSWLCLCFIAKAYFPQQAPSSAKLSKTVYVNAETRICDLCSFQTLFVLGLLPWKESTPWFRTLTAILVCNCLGAIKMRPG